MPKRTVQAQPQTVINLAPQNPETPEPEKPQEREEKEPGWFISDMMKIPANEWEKIYHLELQRLEPKVPGVAGSKGYLWTFFQPVTYADVKKRWGGGKFRMDLCKNGHYWKTHNFDIEGEPIYDRSREIPPSNGSNGNGLNGNADFQKEFISVLREELQRSRESNQSTGSEHVIDMLTKASERAMEIITKQTPTAANSSTQVSELLAAAEKIANMRAPAGGGIMDKILEAALPLLLNALKPKTLAEQIAEAKAVKELLSGSVDVEPADWKAMGVKMVSEHLPEILDAIKAPAAAAQARAAEANARARTAETLRTVPVNQPPAAQPQPARAPATRPAAPAMRVEGLHVEPLDASNGNGAAGPAPIPTSQEQYDEGLKVQIVNMFRYGATGSAIATFLEDVKPQMAADLMNYTPEQITEFFRNDPILKLMVEDPRWPTVLADARVFLSEEEEPVTVN